MQLPRTTILEVTRLWFRFVRAVNWQAAWFAASTLCWLTLALAMVSQVTDGSENGRGGRPAGDTTVAHLEQQVLAIFDARCVKCHGRVRKKADLDVSNLAAISAGSENGTVVEPGNLQDSLLWQRVSAAEMPPEETLTASELSIVRQWIERGFLSETSTSGGRGVHWAFAVPTRPEVPRIHHLNHALTPIDQFIQHRLEQVGLKLGPEADRLTLIRRVALDLTGLPPVSQNLGGIMNHPGVVKPHEGSQIPF